MSISFYVVLKIKDIISLVPRPSTVQFLITFDHLQYVRNRGLADCEGTVKTGQWEGLGTTGNIASELVVYGICFLLYHSFSDPSKDAQYDRLKSCQYANVDLHTCTWPPM